MESVEETHDTTRAERDDSGGRRCRRCGGAEEFGVTVDLSRFYADERAQVLTRACGARRVRWLLARLARALALPPRLALLAGGRLLPPRDPLSLLREPRQPCAPALQLIPLPEHWSGEEGLRDLSSVHSVDDIDAPVPECDYINIMEKKPQHRDTEIKAALSSAPRLESDVQMERTDFPESVSESQMDVSSDLQQVKRALVSAPRPEFDVQMERTYFPESESESQMDAGSDLQQVKRGLVSAPRPESDVQMQQTHFLRSESELQMDTSSDLQQVKQNALELLDRCILPAAGAGRRPRVRRRRRRAPPAGLPSPASLPAAVPASQSAAPTQPQSPPAPARHSPPALPPAPPPLPRSPAVRRNRSPRATSTPRLVRALC